MSSGVRKFSTGETLTSAYLNDYLMQQTVMVFDSAAARDAMFTSAGVTVTEGMVVYLRDTNQMLVWSGTAWVIPNAPAQNPTGLEFIHAGSFSGVTEYIPPSDVFSNVYDHYQIKLTIDSFVNTGQIFMQMRNSGGNNATNYRFAGMQSYSDSAITASINSAGAQNNGFLLHQLDFDSTEHDGMCVTYDIMNPYRNLYTTASGFMLVTINPQYYARWAYQKHSVVASYTNFRVHGLTSLSMTGNIKVYGYRNS